MGGGGTWRQRGARAGRDGGDSPGPASGPVQGRPGDAGSAGLGLREGLVWINPGFPDLWNCALPVLRLLLSRVIAGVSLHSRAVCWAVCFGIRAGHA